MIEFNSKGIKTPGFKYDEIFIRELSLRQMAVLQKQSHETEMDQFLASIAMCLVNEAGDKIITNAYTIDDFADEVPQRMIAKIADAFTEINGGDEEKEIETAKKS